MSDPGMEIENAKCRVPYEKPVLVSYGRAHAITLQISDMFKDDMGGGSFSKT